MILEDIAGASLLSLELLPLTFYRPGTAALALWIWSGSEGIKGCSSCPWSPLYDPRSSGNYFSAPVERILKRMRELGVEILFLHGGEPVRKPWFQEAAGELSSKGIFLGAKARIEVAAENLERLDLLEALLLEIPAWLGEQGVFEIQRLANFLERRDLYVEVVVTDLAVSGRGVAEILEILGELSRARGRSVPAGFIAQGLDDGEIKSLSKILGGSCRACYIIESHQRYRPQEILCPACGKTVVAKRMGALVLPTLLECPSCGSTVFKRAPPRILRPLPLMSPVMI